MSPGRQFALQRLRQVLTIALIGLAFLFAIALANQQFIASIIQDRAAKGAAPQIGVAKVTDVTYRAAKEQDPMPATAVHLKLNNQSVTVNTLAPPRLGESVRVQYKVGKTGQIYVERILSD